MDELRHKRFTGFILGLVLGCGYALSANLANRIILPDIPLYSPPPGALGSFLITALMFGLMGLISAWGEESLPDILTAGLMGSFITWLQSFANASSNVVGMIGMLMVFIPPLLFFYLPLCALVRWLVTSLDWPPSASLSLARRLRPTFYSFLVLLVLGAFEIHSKETRVSLIRMQALLEAGMQAEPTSFRNLPKPLQTVEGFFPKAAGEYSFLVGSDPDTLPVQRPVVNYREPEPLIIVRFENGFRFGCVFSPPYENPACIDF